MLPMQLPMAALVVLSRNASALFGLTLRVGSLQILHLDFVGGKLAVYNSTRKIDNNLINVIHILQ